MPQSTKGLRKLRQRQAEERGEVHGKAAARSKPATEFAVCTICKVQMRLSKRNIDLVQHVDSKHPGKTFDECWPGQTHD
eukprot:m51a1_g4642 hypothetical protein (79) ;mRNA; f:348030-348340